LLKQAAPARLSFPVIRLEKMKLELSNGSVFNDPVVDQLEEALQLVEPGQNNTLVLHKSATSSLRVVNEQPRRYYLYVDSLNSHKRSLQPVSLHIAKRALIAYAQGKRRWQSGVRFEDAEPGSEGITEHAIEDMSSNLLELRKKRLERAVIIPVLFLSIGVVSFLIYWFVAWRNERDGIELMQIIYGVILLFGTLFIAIRARSKLKEELRNREEIGV
jgi:hypothetical protein